ncbi:MAG: YceI family protein [Armatimonadota bacterium]
MLFRFSTAATLLLALALPVPSAVAAAPASPAAGQQRFVIVPAESQVTYRVGEVLISQGNRFNIAIGTTNAIRGEIVIDRASPRNSRIGPITVDISRFQSDSARRDNAIRDRWLESSRFPTAEFTPTSIEGLPETYAEGRELSLQMSGNLKVRDVTRPTTFTVTLRLQGTALTGVGNTTIRMTDFGFDPPSIFGILRAENEAKLEFRFVARPAQ